MSTDTTPISALVGRADEIYRDYSLQSVRDWKARTGGLAGHGGLESPDH